RRFEQEALAVSALNHPNIVTIYDIGDDEAGPFIVMELVEGRTLRELIKQGLPLDSTIQLGEQMAKALSAAHTAGVLHRDVKPENIIVREDGYVKVLDFGIARLAPAGAILTDAERRRLTTPGILLGTVGYMSPEQARRESASPASDVFSLGIILYE